MSSKNQEKITRIRVSKFKNKYDIEPFLRKNRDKNYSISGSLDVYGRPETSPLENTISISKDLSIYGSTIKSLGKLKSVGGRLMLVETDIMSLGNLETIGGDFTMIDFKISSLESLGNLKSVGGSMNLSYAPIKSLGKLTSVGDYLDLEGSSVESFGDLTSVGGDLYLFGTPLLEKYTEEEIRKIVRVSGNIFTEDQRDHEVSYDDETGVSISIY